MILNFENYITANGRHPNFLNSFPEDYRANAMKIIALASELASLAGFTITDVTSGYRTPEFNKSINGSASSKHCFAQAIDIADPTLFFGSWLATNEGALRERGCAIESLKTTHASQNPAGCWVHIQSVIPASGNVVFEP